MLIGGRKRGARPRRRNSTWIRHLPTRPLPSPKGWIVSNCAWAIAAWATGEMSSRFMNPQRSSSRRRTRSAGGPTYSALLGSTPPIQLGPSRICPAILSSGGTTAISRWIASTASTSGSGRGTDRQGTLHRLHRPDDLARLVGGQVAELGLGELAVGDARGPRSETRPAPRIGGAGVPCPRARSARPARRSAA